MNRPATQVFTRRPVAASVIAATVLLVGCSSSDQTSRAADATSSSVAGTSDVPMSTPPEEPGPFAVGRTTVTLSDEARSGRSLTTDIWYPIDASSALDAPPSEYQFDASIPPIDLEVAKAGVAVASDGPFPLIVFSHGSPSIRYQSLFFAELLASHGFVVAAPDHAGDSAFDALNGSLTSPAENVVNRPADLAFTIDAMLDGAVGVPSDLPPAIDRTQIGIAGHSGGGDTVLATASGRNGVGPDDRVTAVLAWTPASGGLSDTELEAIDVPTMLFGATRDDIAPISPNVDRPWTLISGRPLYRVELIDGGHDQFTNVCDFLAEADADPEFPQNLRPVVDVPAQDACTPEFVAIEVAQQMIARYSVAFFQLHVEGDQSAAEWLTPEAAEETPEVSFEVKQ
jgi:predicted dienelactone hydrolase